VYWTAAAVAVVEVVGCVLGTALGTFGAAKEGDCSSDTPWLVVHRICNAHMKPNNIQSEED
jgi:hypothetical protein